MDPNFYLTMAVAGLAGLTILVGAGLTGWRGWLQLRRQQLLIDHDMAHDRAPAGPTIGSRIEIADLKERIRKLEAIAAGVDL